MVPPKSDYRPEIGKKFEGDIQDSPQPDGNNLYWCNSIINVHYAGPLNNDEKAQLKKDILMLAAWPEDSDPDAFWRGHNAPKSIYMRHWIMKNLYKNHPEIYAELIKEPALQDYLLSPVDKVYAHLSLDGELSTAQEEAMLTDFKHLLSMDAADPAFSTIDGLGSKDVLVENTLMRLRYCRPKVYDNLVKNIPVGTTLLSDDSLKIVDAARNQKQNSDIREAVKEFQTTVEPLSKTEGQPNINVVVKVPDLMSQFEQVLHEIMQASSVAEPKIASVMSLFKTLQQLQQQLPAEQRAWAIEKLKQKYASELAQRLTSTLPPPGLSVPTRGPLPGVDDDRNEASNGPATGRKPSI